MRKNRGAVNYAAGTALSRIGLTNMYIYGGALISAITLAYGLLVTAGNLDMAIRIWFEWYVMKLLPWPIDELLLAETLFELVVSHAVTITIGLATATMKWRTNVR